MYALKQPTPRHSVPFLLWKNRLFTNVCFLNFFWLWKENKIWVTHWLFVPARRYGSLHWNKPCGEAHDLVFHTLATYHFLWSHHYPLMKLVLRIGRCLKECGRVDGWSSWDGCNIGVPAVWISSITTTLWSLVCPSGWSEFWNPVPKLSTVFLCTSDR